MPMQYRPAISAMVSAGMPMAAPGKRKIKLKLLVITATGDEPSYLAAEDTLKEMGVPFDTMIANTANLTPDMLSNGVDICNYNGILLAVGDMGVWDGNNQTWTSAFTTDEWTTLENYEIACSARELTWYGFPGAQVGLSAASNFSDADIVTARTTSAGKQAFPYVNGPIPIKSAYGYKASVIDTAACTSLIESDDGYALVAECVSPDGRESMMMTVDSNPSLVHSLVLGKGFINWVSRGMFVGNWPHAYLTAQCDDMFIADDLWNPVTHSDNPELNGENAYRITGDDLHSFVAWQNRLAAKLSPGSTFKTLLAFNGGGTVDSGDSEDLDQTLLAEAQAAGDNLMWISHTWDHENMDLMASSDAAAEVTQNCDLAAQYNLNGFSCSELVTPDMSGLTNDAAMTGMLQAGASIFVSDTSVTDDVAKARNTEAGDNPAFNVGRRSPLDARIYKVPRHPLNLFYNVHRRNEEVDEFNTIYRTYFGRDLSYDEILDTDSSVGLSYLLKGDIDPWMCHQSNLSIDTINGEEHSLIGDWIEAAARKFAALENLSIETLPLQEIAREMQAREAFNQCGVEATYVEADSGPTVELRSTDTCVVPIAGVPSNAGTVEVYGGVSTVKIPVSAGDLPKVIQLPKACPLGSSACPAAPPTSGCNGG